MMTYRDVLYLTRKLRMSATKVQRNFDKILKNKTLVAIIKLKVTVVAMGENVCIPNARHCKDLMVYFKIGTVTLGASPLDRVMDL